MQVIKRDNRIVNFDKDKITNAIISAMTAVGNVDVTLATKISEDISNMNVENITVEDIQDIIEKKLMASSYKDVAKAFIIYRNERTKERERKSSIVQKIHKRNNALDIENANANVDEKSFSGREKEASSDAQKEIALDYIMPKDISDAHKAGLIYHHDLEKYPLGEHNCLFVRCEELFKNGFSTRNGDIRPPATFSSACQQLAVIFQCQSQVQYGGVATAHIDFDLAPFVLKSFYKYYETSWRMYQDFLNTNEDIPNEIKEAINNKVSIDDDVFKAYSKVYSWAMELLEKEGKQSTEALYHNLNTLESRQGSQVPFTSINTGRDTSFEGRLVSKWLMNASLSGIGRHHLTSIFPISIFQYKKGVNAKPGDANYDLKKLAIKSLSRRIYPNMVNCDYSNAHETEGDIDTYYATMGCRTSIGYDRHGMGYTRVGRGNNNPITIILPKLGIEYGICLGKRDKPDIEGFYKALEETLHLVEKAHLDRFEIMKRQKPSAAPFMYQNHTIADAENCKENVSEALKHNTFAIGYIGIAEMCQALFGKNHVYDSDVHSFALSVVKKINEFAREASERNDLNFGCYATPAEGLSRTALVTLRKQYGVIENVTSREYLTNSHHVPVWEKVSIYDKLRIEAPFCKYPTAGCITYIELESTFMQNEKAIEDIIDYAFDILDIPYLAFNFPIDTCLNCGYQDEIKDKCPQCGNEEIQRLRRVTGYLTTDYRNFNDGKRKEVEERVKHTAYTKFD